MSTQTLAPVASAATQVARRVKAEDFQFYVRQIYRLFRISSMHLPNNAAVAKMIEQTMNRFKELRDLDLDRLNILFVDKTVFVNGQLLKANPDIYQLAISLAGYIQKLGFNEMTIAWDVQEEDLRALMAVFVGAWKPGSEAERNEVKFKRVTLRRVKSEVLELLRSQPVSARERLVRSYASALVVMRHAWEKLCQGKPTSFKSLKRVVQQLVRASAENPVAFQLMTRMRNVHDDPAGQSVKTAMLAIATLRPVVGDLKVLTRAGLTGLYLDLGRPRALGVRDEDRSLDPSRLPALTAPQRNAVPDETAVAGISGGQLHPESLERVIVAFESQQIALAPDLAPIPNEVSIVDLEPYVLLIARRYTEAMAFDVRTQRSATPEEAVTLLVWSARNRIEVLVSRLLATALRIQMPPELFETATAKDVMEPRRLLDRAVARAVAVPGPNLSGETSAVRRATAGQVAAGHDTSMRAQRTQPTAGIPSDTSIRAARMGNDRHTTATSGAYTGAHPHASTGSFQSAADRPATGKFAVAVVQSAINSGGFEDLLQGGFGAPTGSFSTVSGALAPSAEVTAAPVAHGTVPQSVPVLRPTALQPPAPAPRPVTPAASSPERAQAAAAEFPDAGIERRSSSARFRTIAPSRETADAEAADAFAQAPRSGVVRLPGSQSSARIVPVPAAESFERRSSSSSIPIPIDPDAFAGTNSTKRVETVDPGLYGSDTQRLADLVAPTGRTSVGASESMPSTRAENTDLTRFARATDAKIPEVPPRPPSGPVTTIPAADSPSRSDVSPGFLDAVRATQAPSTTVASTAPAAPTVVRPDLASLLGPAPGQAGLPVTPAPPTPASPSTALRALIEKSTERRVPAGENSAHRLGSNTSNRNAFPSTGPASVGIHSSGWANVAADALREASATKQAQSAEAQRIAAIGETSQQRMAAFVAEAVSSPSVQQQPTVAANANAATVAVSASGSASIAATVTMPSSVATGAQTVAMNPATAAAVAAASLQQATVARPVDSIQELLRRAADGANSPSDAAPSTPVAGIESRIATEQPPGLQVSPVAEATAPVPSQASVSDQPVTVPVQRPLPADSPTVAWSAPASAPANDVRARLAAMAQKLADHRAATSSYQAVTGDTSAVEPASRLAHLVTAPGDSPATSTVPSNTDSRPVPVLRPGHVTTQSRLAALASDTAAGPAQMGNAQATAVVAMPGMPRPSAVQDPSHQRTSMAQVPPVAPVTAPTALAPTPPGPSDDEEPNE